MGGDSCCRCAQAPALCPCSPLPPPPPLLLGNSLIAHALNRHAQTQKSRRPSVSLLPRPLYSLLACPPNFHARHPCSTVLFDSRCTSPPSALLPAIPAAPPVCPPALHCAPPEQRLTRSHMPLPPAPALPSARWDDWLFSSLHFIHTLALPPRALPSLPPRSRSHPSGQSRVRCPFLAP